MCEQLLADRAGALARARRDPLADEARGPEAQGRRRGQPDLETAQGSYRLRADWVVACDGARSAVRQAMGLRFSGSTYDGTYIIVDIHLEIRLSDRAPRLVRSADQPRLDDPDAPPAARHLARRLPAARR